MENAANSRLKALFKLLETETDQYGPLLKEALARAIQQNPDDVQRTLQEEFSSSAPRNVVRALEEICWEDLAKALAAFCAKINPDLEEGLSLLAKFTSPTTSRGDLAAPLDDMAAKLRPALVNAAQYAEIIDLLGHFIFNLQGFQTVPTVTDIKDLSFPHFLQTKQGSGLTMACLYLCLGQRFGMEMDVVDMAGRLLVHVRDNAHETSFLIDPLDHGKMLSEDDCRHYIHTRGLEKEDELFVPLSSRLIVRRFIANMIYILNKLHDERRLKYLRNYLEIIKG